MQCICDGPFVSNRCDPHKRWCCNVDGVRSLEIGYSLILTREGCDIHTMGRLVTEGERLAEGWTWRRTWSLDGLFVINGCEEAFIKILIFFPQKQLFSPIKDDNCSNACQSFRCVNPMIDGRKSRWINKKQTVYMPMSPFLNKIPGCSALKSFISPKEPKILCRLEKCPHFSGLRQKPMTIGPIKL